MIYMHELNAMFEKFLFYSYWISLKSKSRQVHHPILIQYLSTLMVTVTV